MMTKYVSYMSPLWKTAVHAFITAVTTALPIVARCKGTAQREKRRKKYTDADNLRFVSDLSEDVVKRIWTQLYACLQEFLFHDR